MVLISILKDIFKYIQNAKFDCSVWVKQNE